MNYLIDKIMSPIDTFLASSNPWVFYGGWIVTLATVVLIPYLAWLYVSGLFASAFHAFH